MYYQNIVYRSIWNQGCTNAKWLYFYLIIAFDKEKIFLLRCQLRVEPEVAARTQCAAEQNHFTERQCQTRPFCDCGEWGPNRTPHGSWAQVNAATLPRPQERGNVAFCRLTWMPTFVLSTPAFAVLCRVCLLVKSIWYRSQNSSLWMPSSNLGQKRAVPVRWCVCWWYTLRPRVLWHLC